MKNKEPELKKTQSEKKSSFLQTSQKSSTKNVIKANKRKNPTQTNYQKGLFNIKKNDNKNIQKKSSPHVSKERTNNVNSIDQYNNFTRTLAQGFNMSKESTKIDSATISQYFKEFTKNTKGRILKSHSSKNITEIHKNSKECSMSIISIINKVKNILSLGLKNPLAFINEDLEKIEKLKKIKQNLDDLINKDGIMITQSLFAKVSHSKIFDNSKKLHINDVNGIELLFYEIQDLYNNAKELKINFGYDSVKNKSLKNSNSEGVIKIGKKNNDEIALQRHKLLNDEKKSITVRSEKRMEIYKRFFIVSTDCMKDISKVIKNQMRKVIDKKEKEKKVSEYRERIETIVTPSFKLFSQNLNEVYTRNNPFEINLPTIEKVSNLSKTDKPSECNLSNFDKSEHPSINKSPLNNIIIVPQNVEYHDVTQRMYYLENEDTYKHIKTRNSNVCAERGINSEKSIFDYYKKKEENSPNRIEKDDSSLLMRRINLEKKNSFVELRVTSENISYEGHKSKQEYENKSINCNISQSLNEVETVINNPDKFCKKIDKKVRFSDSNCLEVSFNGKKNSSLNEMNSMLSKTNQILLTDEKYTQRYGKESAELINFSLKKDDEIYYKIEKLKDKYSTLQSNDDCPYYTPNKSKFKLLLMGNSNKLSDNKGVKEKIISNLNSSKSLVTLKSGRHEEDTFIKSECHLINYIPDSIVKSANIENSKVTLKKRILFDSNISDETIIINHNIQKENSKRYLRNKDRNNLSVTNTYSSNIFFEAKSHLETKGSNNEIGRKTYRTNIHASYIKNSSNDVK